MEDQDAIDYLNNLERGMFCTVNIPIYNNEKIAVTSMYMGKDKSGKATTKKRKCLFLLLLQ